MRGNGASLLVSGKGPRMTAKVREIFRNNEEIRTVTAGTVIFSTGETGSEMYGIVSGEVELRLGDDTIAVLGPDEGFGEMALIDSSPRMATAVATADSELAVISQRLFLFLVHETPMFALHVMSCMADRLRHQPVEHTGG